MSVPLNSQAMRKLFSIAGVAGMGLFLSFPAIAQTTTSTYSITNADREVGTFICINNPYSGCENPTRPVLNRKPTPRYTVTEETRTSGTFTCINNPNPKCENPVRFD